VVQQAQEIFPFQELGVSVEGETSLLELPDLMVKMVVAAAAVPQGWTHLTNIPEMVAPELFFCVIQLHPSHLENLLLQAVETFLP
jgi:hypothetical protein